MVLHAVFALKSKHFQWHNYCFVEIECGLWIASGIGWHIPKKRKNAMNSMNPILLLISIKRGVRRNALFALFACCLLNLPVAPTWARSPVKAPPSADVVGTIDNLNGASAIVTLGHDGYLRSTSSDASGNYTFKQVPFGKYFIKAEANGYALGQAKEITVPQTAAASGFSPLHAPSRAPTSTTTAPVATTFQAQALDHHRFSYHWSEDGSRSGYETSAYINQPPAISFLNETISPADPSSANTLQYDYNIILSNADVTWSQETASRLLSMMKIIPQAIHLSATNGPLKPSKWILTDQHITDDISVVRTDAGDTVTISTDAMTYAHPRMVLVDGVKGKFFSKRLHHALVRYVTTDGADVQAVDKILRERFGTSIIVPDYTALTATTTQEDQYRFTQFRPSELISIINMFEEMPEGFHVIKGLNYLVRRNFGQKNPRYFCVAALAFPSAGYIEFVDGAFSDLNFTHHVIIHEKSHFMWEFLFDANIRDAWASTGGWSRDSADPDGWSTTQTTSFVSSYAHKKNPNEDMAESIAAFILDPGLIKSRSVPKYEFIRDNIMHGSVFVSEVRSDLQFNVLNLFPDYDYPGKIKSVDVTVDGAPDSDKIVTIDLGLNAVPGRFDGASAAYMILRSEGGTYKELWLFPKAGNSALLTGTLVISKYAKAGFWSTD
jgi:hypothetical protein